MIEPASTHKIQVVEGTVVCDKCGEPASWIFEDPKTGAKIKRSSSFVKMNDGYVHRMCIGA